MSAYKYIITVLIIAAQMISSNIAFADTAIFLQPSMPDPIETTALSTSGDNAGFTVSQSQSLQILFDQPFITTRTDRVSIFTLPPVGGGQAIGQIRIGRYVDGEIQFVTARNFNSNGRTVNFFNFVARECEGLGGCNFIEVVTNSARRGAEGVQIDYIQVNGEVVSVVAATPEPGTWALMIIGFFAVAWRMKALRSRAYQFSLNTQAIPPPSGRLGCHKQFAFY